MFASAVEMSSSAGLFSIESAIALLTLTVLLLIGVVLVSEGAGTPISKGYVYFAMAFSLTVEFLNLRMRAKRSLPRKGEGEVGIPRGKQFS